MSELVIVKGQEFNVVVKKNIGEQDIFLNEYQKAASILDEIIGAMNSNNSVENEYDYEGNISKL